MSVALIRKNYNTNHCVFSIDSESDLSKLPTLLSPGKDSLANIRNCSQGSIAITTTGIQYTIKGNGIWVKSVSSSGGGGGSTDDTESVGTDFIENLVNGNGDDEDIPITEENQWIADLVNSDDP